MSLRRHLACALFVPTVALAQIGASLGVKRATGTETARANADRHGVEFRLQYDAQLTGPFSWRAELAGVQMQYPRDIPGLDRRQVSENGLELPLLVTMRPRAIGTWRFMALGGVVPSWRLNCGASGGFVACDATPGARVGALIGASAQTDVSDRRELQLDIRHARGVVAGAGASVWTVGLGVRSRVRRPSA